MFRVFEKRIHDNPDLHDETVTIELFQKHKTSIFPLMTALFPPSTWETAIAGAVSPLTHRPIFYTPTFERVLMSGGNQIGAGLKQPEMDIELFHQLRAFWLILDKVYDIDIGRNIPVIRSAPDPDTGLDRFFRILPDWQFLDVHTDGVPIPLSPESRELILQNIDKPEVLARLIPPQTFHFRGFIVINAVDVTTSEVVLDLERDLIDQEAIFCTAGFGRLQRRLQTLFGRPNLRAGMGALQGSQVWVVKDDEHDLSNCIFKNSYHVALADLQGSMWIEAVNQSDMLIVPDLAQRPNLCPAEQDMLDSGARSVLITPLFYQGDKIGTFFISSPQPNDFTAIDKMILKPIAPLFSVAVKRGLEDINNEVQSIIKEKCTALHPSVEWRFRQAAFAHLERLHRGEASELEPIVFKHVVPLYGQTDIRGSSEARGDSIQADLIEQLNLANEVLRWASQAKSWPLIDQFQYRIEMRIASLTKGLKSDAESEIGKFLHHEVEPTFDELLRLGPRVVQAIEKYRRAIDPERGFVYSKRKAFESSVAMLNERLSTYLDQEEGAAQKEFPHYFEKHQTDGIDYVIYLGASMREDGRFTPFHLQNLILWQLILACGMAWHTEQAKPQLAVPLDTCHLIFYNTPSLAIRFRYDEKRFDVDGAYDVRHEIIKSRLDKALVKGKEERLTQPGRIAIVYAQPQEADEMRQHIKYLQSQGHLLNDVEMLDLEDLPGVRGLKAMRVGVNLEAQALVQRVEQVAAG
jgi:hypothetical protein